MNIGQKLLHRGEEFMRKIRLTNLFSWVVSNPENKPAIRFHKKHGFTAIGLYEAKESWGIRNYKSILFWKSIVNKNSIFNESRSKRS